MVARWEWTPPPPIQIFQTNEWHIYYLTIFGPMRYLTALSRKKSLLTMRMNTEFFCGPLFIEVTFFGETTFFCVYQFLLRAVPILVACSMMHIMYITVRKHPQFLFFCCCSRNTTVGFREFISNGSSDAWRVTMESDPLLGAASWGALCFKVDFIAWMYIRLPFQRFPRYKLTM